MMKEFKNEYVISSRRNRSDEQDINFYSNNIYAVGDVIELDGIEWDIVEVVSRDVADDAEALIVLLVDECGYSISQAEAVINQMIADNVELVSENLWGYLTRD